MFITKVVSWSLIQANNRLHKMNLPRPLRSSRTVFLAIIRFNPISSTLSSPSKDARAGLPITNRSPDMVVSASNPFKSVRIALFEISIPIPGKSRVYCQPVDLHKHLFLL